MIVDCAYYKDGARQHEGPIPLDEAAKHAKGGGEFAWIGLHEPERGRPGAARASCSVCTSWPSRTRSAPHQRPKIEDYDESWFIVLRTAHYHQNTEQVHFGEIHVFAGPGYVITVRHGPGSELSSARSRLEARPDLLKMGPAAAVWAILDKVVDDYMPVDRRHRRRHRGGRDRRLR